jgi:hypothetical protein
MPRANPFGSHGEENRSGGLRSDPEIPEKYFFPKTPCKGFEKVIYLNAGECARKSVTPRASPEANRANPKTESAGDFKVPRKSPLPRKLLTLVRRGGFFIARIRETHPNTGGNSPGVTVSADILLKKNAIREIPQTSGSPLKLAKLHKPQVCGGNRKTPQANRENPRVRKIRAFSRVLRRFEASR